jgi:hypothetical protein
VLSLLWTVDDQAPPQCLECGLVIGGQSHQIRADNRSLRSIDQIRAMPSVDAAPVSLPSSSTMLERPQLPVVSRSATAAPPPPLGSPPAAVSASNMVCSVCHVRGQFARTQRDGEIVCPACLDSLRTTIAPARAKQPAATAPVPTAPSSSSARPVRCLVWFAFALAEVCCSSGDGLSCCFDRYAESGV